MKRGSWILVKSMKTARHQAMLGYAHESFAPSFAHLPGFTASAAHTRGVCMRRCIGMCFARRHEATVRSGHSGAQWLKSQLKQETACCTHGSNHSAT
jgi:hypothetical protein